MNRAVSQQGFTLLITILVLSIVLAISISALTISLKEFKLSRVSTASQKAFAAADAGIECAYYWDTSAGGDQYDVPRNNSITLPCMGVSGTAPRAVSGDSQDFEYSWDAGEPVCTKISVVKFFDLNNSSPIIVGGQNFGNCPQGTECTIVTSRGYDNACNQIGTLPTVERALQIRF